jgi:hypothetical protein
MAYELAAQFVLIDGGIGFLSSDFMPSSVFERRCPLLLRLRQMIPADGAMLMLPTTCEW